MAVSRRYSNSHYNAADSCPNGLNDPFLLMDKNWGDGEVTPSGSYLGDGIKTDAQMKASLRQGRKLPGE